ncbi:MBOAT-domain-containing protein [Martensiomyces pterosporus]|nr:MBOAT-domain-containing protein [Martensiomyces pterosporus]
MQVLNQALAWISVSYLGGIPVDRIATIVGVLLAYALAHIFRRIPATNASMRHMFSIISMLFLFGAVQEQYLGLVHLFVGSLVVYFLMATIKGSLMPKVVFLVAMLHMSYSQLRRQWGETGDQVSFDYTGAQMVFVIKVTSLACCIYDGTCDPKSLTEYQRKNAVGGVPSFLEFLGYVSFFPGFAVGPAFELATYRRMIAFDNAKAHRQINARAYTTLLVGVFWLVVYVLYGDKFTYHFMTTEAFAEYGFARKTVYLCTSGVVTRAAYYAAWKMSEGACVLAGLGFDGYREDGSIAWLDISNVHVLDVEMGSSLKSLIDGWNVGTNTWLRHHVYLRISPKGKKGSSTRATILTFMVSAWWHGFYPGYYLTFLVASLASSAARILRRNLRPLVVDKEDPKTRTRAKMAYDLAGWTISKYALDFVVAPFMVLSLSLSLKAWYNNYFLLPIGVALVEIAFRVLGAGRYIHAFASSKAPQNPIDKAKAL